MIGRGFGVFLIVHPSLSSQLLLELPMIFHLYFLLFLCDHHRELFIFSLINKIAYFPSFFFFEFCFFVCDMAINRITGFPVFSV